MKHAVLPIAFIPDAVFPSNNKEEIPTLNLALQAEYIESPLKIWGNQARKQKHAGTWAFYCYDYKFTALWKHPEIILQTGASVYIEPNFSTSEDMPRAVALYGIFRKRWLCRYWQTQGIRIIVDLCVAEKFLDDNMLGIPDGWSCFATRVMRGHHELISMSYEKACEKAGGAPNLFLVYGGGKEIKEYCRSRGWLHIEEQMQKVKKDMARKSP